MSDRHEILSDADFWSRLEFELSGWFRTSGDSGLRGYWCDGFIPRSAHNTKGGVEVKGAAWIEEGHKSHGQFAFSLAVPQRLLFRRRNSAVLAVMVVDVQHRKLQLALVPRGQQGPEDESTP